MQSPEHPGYGNRALTSRRHRKTPGQLSYDPLLEGKSVENDTHVTKDMVGSGAQKPIQAPHPPSQKAKIK